MKTCFDEGARTTPEQIPSSVMLHKKTQHSHSSQLLHPQLRIVYHLVMQLDHEDPQCAHVNASKGHKDPQTQSQRHNITVM